VILSFKINRYLQEIIIFIIKQSNLQMGAGSTSSNQNANGQVGFNPTSIGGGNIQVGGSVGQGAVSQGNSQSATGASVGLDFKMEMPGMDSLPGMGKAPALQLINLRGLDLEQQIQFINLNQQT
tara:strand:- start:681 stop:1052 length:372 start_codon:yes stop_codon:yes gene_type:complete